MGRKRNKWLSRVVMADCVQALHSAVAWICTITVQYSGHALCAVCCWIMWLFTTSSNFISLHSENHLVHFELFAEPLLSSCHAFLQLLCCIHRHKQHETVHTIQLFTALLENMPSVLWRCWLGGRKGIRPVKKLSSGVLAWLYVCSEVQTCIWTSWCHCHSLSLASVKSRLVLRFWYWLTRVVPDKGLLNECVCVLENMKGIQRKISVYSGGIGSICHLPVWTNSYHLRIVELCAKIMRNAFKDYARSYGQLCTSFSRLCIT